MRILQVINSLDPAGGGPAEVAKQIAVHLGKTGHSIEILSLDNPGSAFLGSYPAQVHALGPPIIKNYGFTTRLIPWLRNNIGRFDAVIVHGIWGYTSFGTWLALKGSGKPYFVFTHGMLDPWFKKRYPLKHLKKLLYWPWADYRVLRDAKAVLFTSEEEKLLARASFRLYKCNEQVLNLGVPQYEGDGDAVKNIFLNSYPQLKGKRIILFLGRVHPKKGCDLLLEAFGRVTDPDKRLHLVFAGPDRTGWQAALHKMSMRFGTDDRISFTGMLSGDLVWGSLYASEAFILPSHQENFGIAVVQAMACSIPVLISNKVNIWREIESYGAGIIADDNLSGTTGLLKQWLELSDNKKSLMKDNARKCYLANFKMDMMMDKLIRILSQTDVNSLGA